MLGDGEMRPGVIKSGWDELHYSLEFGGRYGSFQTCVVRKWYACIFFPKCSFPEVIVSHIPMGSRGPVAFSIFNSFIITKESSDKNHGACQNRRAWLAQCQFDAKSLSFTCVVWKSLELCSRMFYFEICTVISTATIDHVTCGGSGRSSFGMSSAKLAQDIVSEFTILHPSIHVLNWRNADVAAALYDIIRVYTLIAACIKRKTYSCHCTTLLCNVLDNR